ncbi:MAG: rfaF, partial [Spartobacteria bacterium]|nr:rfaF [Spartobacteria bacterium]
MRHFSVYVLYRAASAFLRAVPLPGIFRLGQILGFCAWLILPGYRRLALRNASIAFDHEGSAGSLGRVVRRHFQLLGANLLSSIKITTMPVDELEGRTRINNLEVIHQYLRAGRPVVVILSHIGNWELLAQLWPKFIGSVRNGTVYQRLSNPWIDRHVRQLRSRSGVELFDRKEGFQKAIDLLRSGGVIGILSDQHAGDHGLWVPFFGKLASTTPLPALLAKRTGAVVVGIAVYTEGTARWRIDISSAIETSGQPVEFLTFKANEVIEAQIRRAPEDWFWVHDRWKTPRPNLLLTMYKRGVYLPPAMSSDQLKPFRILIRTSNWLGDAVMSVPAVRAIKHGRPDAHVTILAPQNLAPIWKLIPEVDEIVSTGTSSLFSTVRSIRRHSRFDAAVLFPNSLRVALEVWLGGVPRRIGYRGHSRAWLLNQVVRKRGKPGPLEHQSLHYLRIAQNLGAEVDGTSTSFPDEFPVDTATAAVNNGPIKIGLCPGAEYGPAKRWLPERFGEVAAQIGAERNVQ